MLYFAVKRDSGLLYHLSKKTKLRTRRIGYLINIISESTYR